jgi:hypothetical protein
MSRSVFDVVLLGGSTHDVEADNHHADVTGRSVTFVRGDQIVAQFFNVSSVVKRPAAPESVPAQCLCASAATELGMVDLLPPVSIGTVNIIGGDPQEFRSSIEAFLADLRNTGPIR